MFLGVVPFHHNWCLTSRKYICTVTRSDQLVAEMYFHRCNRLSNTRYNAWLTDRTIPSNDETMFAITLFVLALSICSLAEGSSILPTDVSLLYLNDLNGKLVKYAH